MFKSSIAKGAVAVALSAACVFGLASCGGSKTVAATVNGTNIYEEDVTEYIQNFRTQQSLTDESTWGTWLASYGYTPASVREQIINSFVEQELVKQAIQKEGITVDSAEVDTFVNQMKSNYDSDEKWKSALESAGLTEEKYRENIELSLKSQALMDKVAPVKDPADEDVLSYAKMYATYYDGARKSSHILVADEATAQEVENKLKSGELSWDEAVAQYSTDQGSKADNGNVGWDVMNSFVTEYTNGLSTLEVDQISEPVKSNYGYHIIKCTEIFKAPAEITSLDQIPAEFLETIRSMLQSQNQSADYSTWLEEFKGTATIEIKDMPNNLPYYLDMTKYEEAAKAAAANSSTSSTATTDTSSSTTESSTTQQ